ncbi:phage tail tape measure protein [Cronobacter malonaticus]
MSNNVALQTLLNTVDQATRPFKSLQVASKTLSEAIRDTQDALRKLNGQFSLMKGLSKTNIQLVATSYTLKKAKRDIAMMDVQFKKTQHPTRAQNQAMKAARKNAAALNLQHDSVRQFAQRQRQALSQGGISTRSLTTEKKRLKNSIGESTSQLDRQCESLARVNVQQTRLKNIQARYQVGKAHAENAMAFGAKSMGLAISGMKTGAAVMSPGFEAAQKNAELQALTGVTKGSSELEALRRQAHQLGTHAYASVQDAVSAQVGIAKAGGDVATIQAAAPVTLKMAQANRHSIEENAGLLMGVKTAFQLSNDKVAHIGDVLSMTMLKTQVDFNGLGEALNDIAPVAKNTGASLEEAAAMVGTLHDAKITGTAAGKASSAVLSSLAAPSDSALDAMKLLGIKRTDSKGDALPALLILKEIQQSLQQNHISQVQRGDYVNAIFGGEVSPAASALMSAASTGKLDALTSAFNASDGKTDELVRIMNDNLAGDLTQFQAAYTAVGTDLFNQQESSLRALVQTATDYMLKLDSWIQKNQGVAQTLGIIALAMTGVLGVVGAIGYIAGPVIFSVNTLITTASSLGAIFTTIAGSVVTAIGAITWPVVGVIAAIVTGALLIVKYWEPISAFFSGVVQGIQRAFVPVSELFSSFKPIFDRMGEWLQTAWQLFIDLIAPVKATQETLESCRDVGVIFGQALAQALLFPLLVLNDLKNGITWVLEKLGIINNESAMLDKTSTGTFSVKPGSPYIPATSSYPGYQAYQPVSAPGGHSYVDQSKTNYNITLQGGSAGAPQMAMMLRDELEKIERDKNAQSRASYYYGY